MATESTVPHFFLVAGPSGVGKDTLLTKLLTEEKAAIAKAVSTTTRAPRTGEVNGIAYHFITKEEFEQRRAQRGFLESALVHGNYYGTSVESVQQLLDSGKHVIKDMDVQGVAQLKTNKDLPIAVRAVFIIPPGDTLEGRLECLRERVKKRESGETDEDLERRMQTARTELEFLENDGATIFDAAIVNEDFDKAYARFKSFILHGKTEGA